MKISSICTCFSHFNKTKPAYFSNKNIVYLSQPIQKDTISFTSNAKTRILKDGTEYFINNTGDIIAQATTNGKITKSTILNSAAKKIPKKEMETWIRNSVKKAASATRASGWKELKGNGINGHMYEVKWLGSAYRLLGDLISENNDIIEFVWKVYKNTH